MVKKFYEIDKYIILGTLPYLYAIRNITEASIMGLGLFMGVLLALVIRKMFRALPSVSKLMLFSTIYTSISYWYVAELSIYFSINNVWLFLLLSNGMAFLILEYEGDGMDIYQITVGTSVAIVFLFIFGGIRTLNVMLMEGGENFGMLVDMKFNALFHPALYPLYLSIFLMISGKFTREFRR